MVGIQIRKQSCKKYEGFPDLESCWEQSKAHKKHFLDHLNCTRRQSYHQIQRGCKYFDDIVEKIAGNKKYRLTFFTFYKIIGEKPLTKQYTGGLIKNPVIIEKLANDIFIVKKSKKELTEPPPEEYYTWPGHFTLEALQAFIFPEDRAEIHESIEECIKRRTFFRNECIKECCRLIDTRSHDVFLLILQVLRARNIYHNNC